MKYHGHLIKSPYNHYFYDVNRNSIISISKELYCFLENGKNGQTDFEQDSVINDIIKLQKEGFLLTNPVKEIFNPEVEDIEYFLGYKLNMLTLQVTQRCNFRCSYCNFTYGDNLTNRSHSSVSMTWETAKKSIDFFAEHSRDKREVTIGFYGGEPLLELELVKRCIRYSKKVFQGKPLRYSMTTNGSLLTPEIVKYLIENNVSLLVSIDGPKHIHDKNRKLFMDGSGTFDLIFDNLNRIYVSAPDYYKKIKVNSVVDPATNIKEVNEYFNQECFEELSISTPMVVPMTGSGLYFSDEYLENANYDNFMELLSKVGHGMKPSSKLSNNYMLDLMDFKKKLKPTETLPERMGHSGPCKTGVFRLFVNIHGEFYPCEKASEASPNMSIGNISDGFDVGRVKEQMNISQLTKEKCINCWCKIFCSICAHEADDGNRFSTELIYSKCPNVKASTENKMRDLIALSEIENIMNTWRLEDGVEKNQCGAISV